VWSRALAGAALRVGAGRFVTGSVKRVRDSIFVQAVVRGVGVDTLSAQRQFMVPASDTQSASAFVPVAIAVLRAMREPRQAWYADTLTADFYAWQAFGRARAQVDEGDVEGARGALYDAASRDP